MFTGRPGKAIEEKQLRRLLGKHKIAAVPHGFRSSFRDWAAEESDHPREVIEAALAHVVRNRVEAAYARSDLFERRRRLMDDWAGYLAGPVAPPTACRRRNPTGGTGHVAAVVVALFPVVAVSPSFPLLSFSPHEVSPGGNFPRPSGDRLHP
ncbi:MAG: hypothetical protein OXG72_18625 [Acidobacteria bacterium]|nr:hypothetical protein [Acidobacteriota bacterium]